MRSRTLMTGVALLLVSAIALAATINASWTNATQNTDGSAIPATGPGSIAQTIVEYGPCNATQTALASVTGTFAASGNGTSATSPNLGVGTWCGQAHHVNTYGVEGGKSNVGSKVVAAPTPGSPSGFGFD